MKKISYSKIRKILDKDAVKKEKSNIGVGSSLKIWDRIVGFFIFLIAIPVLYMVGVAAATNLATSPADIHIISFTTAQAVETIGRYGVAINKILLVIYVIVSFLNIFPKKNLARQILFGTLNLNCAMICLCIGLIPLLFGMTLGAYGWFSVGIQIILAVYIIVINVKKSVANLKASIDGIEVKQNKSHIVFYFLIVWAVSLINRFTFKFGLETYKPNFIELFTGLGVVIWAFVCVAYFWISYRQVILAYYFAKYDDQFYRDLDFTDEEWYGKRKAKRIQKKREKKGEIK